MPRYWTIKEHLKKQIKAHELKIGDKIRPADLMEEFSVSNITVNRALQDLTEDGLLKREKGSGTVVISDQGKSDRNLVCMLIPTVEHLWEDLYFAVLRELNRNGDHVLTYSRTHHSLEEGWDEILSFNVNAVIFNGVVDFPYHIFDATEKLPFLISVVYYDHDKTYPDLACVLPDFYEIGHTSAMHLIKNGYRKVAYYTSPDDIKGDNHTVRIQGIRQAVREQGCPEMAYMEYQKPERDEISNLIELLRKLGTGCGVICSYDYIARHIYTAADELGWQVGKDIGVVGCYNTPWAETFSPNLTTISIQNERIAQEVGRLSREQKDGKIIIPPRLIEREST